MSSPESKLAALNITLPPPPQPGGNYLPFRREGNLVFLAGVISASATAGEYLGQVGDELSLDDGYQAAKLCALNALAVMKSITGSLDDVEKILYVGGYVNAIPAYGKSPSVINGASDLFVELFGEDGQHARAAVAVAGLPKNAAVEIQVNLKLKA
ncbi:RidA family protein [Cerasicoccus maritimus]|uniref:RidA family protein n=1 Tax=Cerasicoccus maritimus TaxID=490089 RepID=UPI0028526778|nr:RidA family protein [Cerasicoccus maritimus]